MSSFFGIPGATPDQNVVNQQRAGSNIANVMRQTGAAYSNKRQADRDMYADALNNRAAMYQGAMNMLGASGGATPNVSGFSRENNPLTLRDTTIGATAGSNATGWSGASPGIGPGGVKLRSPGTYGIIDYLNGKPYDPASYSGTSYQGFGNPNGQPNLNTAPMNGGGPNGAPMTTAPSSTGQGFNFGPRRP